MYKQGSQCTFTNTAEEYHILKRLAEILTEQSPNKQVYVVKDTYLDIGQGWMWTNIINETKDYQVLCPSDWFDLLNKELSCEQMAERLKKDKYWLDK